MKLPRVRMVQRLVEVDFLSREKVDRMIKS